MKARAMSSDKRRWYPWAGIVFFVLLLIPAPEALPQTSTTCATERKEAEAQYRQGYLDEAVALLTKCLNQQDLPKADKIEVYKLLGKIYVAQDNIEQAKIVFQAMLGLNPNVTLDTTTEPPEVMRVFQEVKSSVLPPSMSPPSQGPHPSKKGNKKLLWIGGGAAVVGVAAAILLGGGGNSDKEKPIATGFPLPPGRP